jgi:hypothetical protein
LNPSLEPWQEGNWGRRKEEEKMGREEEGEEEVKQKRASQPRQCLSRPSLH